MQRVQCKERSFSDSTTIDLNSINTSDSAVSIETFVVKDKNVLGYVAASGKLSDGCFSFPESDISSVPQEQQWIEIGLGRRESALCRSTGTR